MADRTARATHVMADRIAGLRGLRIGYTSFSHDHRHPADRGRFPHVARTLGLSFEEAVLGSDYDIVVVTQAADITEWSRVPRGRPRLIYDLVGSHLNAGLFNSPREALRGIGKFISRQSSRLVLDFRRAMTEMCRRADVVVCSTPEQAEAIRPFNPVVYPILDFTSVPARQRKTRYAAGSPFWLVWEGQGANAPTLGVIAEPLRALAQEREIEVHLVTDLEYPLALHHYGRRSTVRAVHRVLPDIRTFFHEWNEHTLGTMATTCDLAVIPLPFSNQLYWHKAENRLLLFWRMGVPVVVSATPAHQRTMRGAGQNHYCSTDAEWLSQLRALAADETLRREAGEGGRTWVENTWREQRLVELWESTLCRAIGV